jgi:L-ascorbate metabolism protein UlaG (beta-lactamase superfamily)
LRIQWYGQSAFGLEGEQASVFIDPFGDMSPAADRGMRFDYPAIEGVGSDLLLVTHEHLDHNGVEAIEGDPTVLRSTAGRLQSPIGEVVAVASEHDQAAGTERGSNTIFVLELDGLRIAHFGDFGQNALRDLRPRWVVPMHYRTPKIGFLESADAFLETFDEVHRCSEAAFETADLPAAEQPVAVVPAAP